MSFATGALTYLAVLIPALQSEWPTPGWLGMVILCLCAWVLIVVDLRRPPALERSSDEASPATPARTDVIF